MIDIIIPVLNNPQRQNKNRCVCGKKCGPMADCKVSQ